MDNPETLVTLGTQDTGQRQTKQIKVRENLNTIKNGQSRDTGNIGNTRQRTEWTNKTRNNSQRKDRQSRMDNPETLVTLGTQDKGQRKTKQIQVREFRDLRGNQEWTIQRH